MCAGNSGPKSPRSKFQFSIRTLFHVMTGLALLLGFATVLPASASQIALGVLWMAASGWLITGIVFAKGDTRAFCIGAAVVVTSMWTGIGGGFIGGFRRLVRRGFFSFGIAAGELEHWLIHLVLLLAAVGNGYLCVVARRYFERRDLP